ncbi:CLUMA_CG007567, isoform A [Clunio marinus]|uniref:CLUMA_CG007567, isoform A n=1 Tax=Clunio marinus TaxID=568069 RepID=A0A1J1I1G1_9DIPT|nr:CLUMA_CG007567, isoform A [Clunio marinus]
MPIYLSNERNDFSHFDLTKLSNHVIGNLSFINSVLSEAVIQQHPCYFAISSFRELIKEKLVFIPIVVNFSQKSPAEDDNKPQSFSIEFQHFNSPALFKKITKKKRSKTQI